ncbi:MAG: hypothetical protein KGI00_02015 [Candidatus Micrarchaeota archaeon]|nr:hypothetical protein [Candidatus Micrarchaeota archaeon]MDE1823826.1 hypothetical protein [Candidatus Micrarchaeota archaeon]MDE1849484.1 hypothetical protein [Candidatus Micrarchaeota archaeon]
MPKANIRLELGSNSKDYVEVLDKPKLSGVTVRSRGRNRSIEMEIEAADSGALISAVGIMLKQLKVVESVGSLIERKVKKRQR